MVIRISMVLLLLASTFTLIAQPKVGMDYLGILRRASTYSTAVNDSFPKFVYQSAKDPALVELRKLYNLDSVAGYGNEASRLISLLHFVHNTVKHDGTALPDR